METQDFGDLQTLDELLASDTLALKGPKPRALFLAKTLVLCEVGGDFPVSVALPEYAQAFTQHTGWL